MLHLIYIKENYGAKNFIQLYTLLGSFYLNNYLRNKVIKDPILETELHNMWSIIRKAPKFDKEYYVYRFISNDDYLLNLNVGDTYDEPSFISTTRNPFYDPKNNVFGYVLIKIKIPANIEGIGLCVESYSLFPQEQEILLAPGKFKLIGIDKDFEYFHTNLLASQQIKKKYEFEYIKPIEKLMFEDYYDNNMEDNIPFINFLKLNLTGSNFKQKSLYFMEECICKINNKFYFYSNIGETKYLFQFYKLDTNIVYNKYFFLQKYDNITEDEFYIIIQDKESATIKLFIEIKDIISINYIFRSLGSENFFKDDELIMFISGLSKAFNIDEVIIHDNYLSYENIVENNLTNMNYDDIDFNNPDTHSMNLFSGYFQFYPEEIINYIYSIRQNKPYVPKYYNIIGIRMLLPYYRIDELNYIKSEDIFFLKEKTLLNKILIKNINKCLYILDFYLFIHENYFYLINELNDVIHNYLQSIGIEDFKENPWNINYFILRPYEYLYQKGIITYLPVNRHLLSENYLNKLNIVKPINIRSQYYNIQ
jgi:hypothetical protein